MNAPLAVFERVVTWVLAAMMVLSIAAAVINLMWEFIRSLFSSPFDALTVAELLEVFGVFLIVLIGLELLETVRSYAGERRIHVEAVILVATLAIVRKVITLDVKEVPPATLFGVAAVLLALAAAYWLMRRSGGAPLPPLPRTDGE
jgi:uncharacterized membrane protein (DUF373 family)